MYKAMVYDMTDEYLYIYICLFLVHTRVPFSMLFSHLSSFAEPKCADCASVSNDLVR